MEIEFNGDGKPFVMWGENKIILEMEPLTDKKMIEKAENELRETPENVEHALAELRRLLKAEKTLFVPVEKDEFLLKFLRPCKFYPESAFKKIQAYYKFRQAHGYYCHDLVPTSVRSPFEHSIVSILSPRDQHGRRIMVVEAGEKWNPRLVPLKDTFRGMQLGLEAAMAEAQTQICGVVVIMDMKGLSFTQVMHFTPSYAKMMVDWVQDCVPVRIKAVHVINQPYVFNMLYALFKPFMREKLRARIHLHGSDMSSLFTHIEPSALRKRHGGLLPEPEIPGDVLWKMLHHYEDDFKVASSYGYQSNNK